MAARFSALSANYQNVLPVDNDASIRKAREKRGLCGGCGTKTSHVQRSSVLHHGFGGKEYVPLTIEGVVRYGRCLYCYPDRPPVVGTQQSSDHALLEEDDDQHDIPVAVVLALTDHAHDAHYDDDNNNNNKDYGAHDRLPAPSAPPAEEELVKQQQAVVAVTTRRAVAEPVTRSPARKSQHRRIVLRRLLHDMAASPGMAYGALNEALLSDSALRHTVSGTEGGMATIVATMKAADQDDLVVLQHACASLMMLAHHSRRNRHDMVACGGVRVVTDALRRHPGSLDLGCTACGALWSLSFDHAAHQRAVGEADAVPLVLAAMTRFAHAAKLQEWACGLLNVLSGEESNRRRIRDADGLDVIVAVLQSHHGDTKILQLCSGLLRNLLEHVPSLLTEEARCVLEKAVKAFPSECSRLQCLL